MLAIILLLLLITCNSFTFSRIQTFIGSTSITHQSPTRAFSTPPTPPRSNLLGNARPPTLLEISSIDQMINKLLTARESELVQTVTASLRVVSSPRFFLRIAERVDQLQGANEDGGEEEASNLMALADRLSKVLSEIVEVTESDLDNHAATLQQILVGLADPSSGEFMLPLEVGQIDTMREKIKQLFFEKKLGEGFLSTVDSWVNKASGDGLDGMVVILQKVFQACAGVMLYDSVKHTELLRKCVLMDAELWKVFLELEITTGEEKVLAIGQLQKILETVVLGQYDTGSVGQRVVAEYVGGLVERINAVQVEQ